MSRDRYEAAWCVKFTLKSKVGLIGNEDCLRLCDIMEEILEGDGMQMGGGPVYEKGQPDKMKEVAWSFGFENYGPGLLSYKRARNAFDKIKKKADKEGYVIEGEVTEFPKYDKIEDWLIKEDDL